ncbi:uncharacterized protein [Physcomitrium patens]|uniref:O-fucosyltransferase family protein n=1 Tax=Physcomitrium patens TaxID=3218 RepID=A0A2K1KW92_PHYPA|nr:uncharacterized protein LOC112279396 [Physcomitrium patens]PNR58038.1 hypothetical protein PHYPA_005033 [Physcomitrium patens]|eukprot:XP_024369556.1 uncharacterized protein LOC112279396 [Physcomitrella patens]
MGMLSKLRFSNRMSVSIQVVCICFGLVMLLTTVSLQVMSKRTWVDYFGIVLADVYPYTTNITTDTATLSQSFSGDLDASELPVGLSFQAPNDDDPTLASSPIGPSDQDVEFLQSREHTSELGVSESLESSTIEQNSPSSSPQNENMHLLNTLDSEISPARYENTAVSDAILMPSPALVSVDTREKFLVPILSWQVGAGNQFMEYLSAAVIARSLNRTLCLSPFFPGPSRHTGRVTSGLAWEDRYEVSSLSRFTQVASLMHCLKECDDTMNLKIMLKNSREARMPSWKRYPNNNEALNLNWDYVKWTKPQDIFASLGNRNERCVGIMGLFPGLRWRGAFLAVSAFLRPAPRIKKIADMLQQYALGNGTRYLAVHWRFEESECAAHHVGLCFVRCDDGSVINSGLHPEAKEWIKAAETPCNRDGHFRGVILHQKDIIEAIEERASNHSVNTIYLATDGWMRGHHSISLLTEIVESLRKRGLTVVGLWKLTELPNFADGTYFDPVKTLGKVNQDLNGAQIALVEQELCSRAVSFMGSGQSTFSLAVFRVRLARRRVEEIVEATAESGGSKEGGDKATMDKRIAEALLEDEHPAGLHCRYLRHMKRHRVREEVETEADEYPDGWLDLLACEGRLRRGGRCRVAHCF